MAIETTHNQETLDTFYDGFGGGWRWRGFGGFGESTTNAVFAQVVAAPAGPAPSTVTTTTLATAVENATTVAIPRLIQMTPGWFGRW